MQKGKPMCPTATFIRGSGVPHCVRPHVARDQPWHTQTTSHHHSYVCLTSLMTFSFQDVCHGRSLVIYARE